MSYHLPSIKRSLRLMSAQPRTSPSPEFTSRVDNQVFSISLSGLSGLDTESEAYSLINIHYYIITDYLAEEDWGHRCEHLKLELVYFLVNNLHTHTIFYFI